MKPAIPKPIKKGHENLCSEIETLIASGGHIGEKAQILKDVIYPHFEKEEAYALPPLGLLLALSEGHWTVGSDEAIEMSDMLQSKLSELKIDHENILVALQNLNKVAEDENNLYAKQFVTDLKLHAAIEDQILYPTTILIGNYLKRLKLDKKE